MNKDVCDFFVNRRVLVFLHNRFKFEGTVNLVSDDSLVLDDIKDGMMNIKLDDISDIREKNNKKQGVD